MTKDIKQLQYFVVSVDMGSFHAAAEVLITTQPNVSKIVKALEEELQMTLLKRNRNGVTITPDGERIYRYAIDILKNMKRIREYKETQGTQKLSICGTPSNRLAAALTQFYKHNTKTKLQLDFWEGNVEDIITRIHKRQSEIGFVYVSNRNLSAFTHQIKAKGLEFHKLIELPLYLSIGYNHRLHGKKSVDDEILAKIRLVQYYEKQYSLYSHLGHLKEDIMYGGEDMEIIYTNSDHLMVQLLKNTDYCTIGSSFTKDKYQEFGIEAIPIEGTARSIDFGYIKRSKSELSKISSIFLNYLDEAYLKKSRK